MPFTVIEGGVFGSKVFYLGITRRKPPAHLADACLTFLGCRVCGNLGCGGCGRSRGKIRASFNVFFIK